MQIPKRIKTGDPETEFDRDLEKELLSYSIELSNLLNNGIRFADNFDAQIKSYTSNGSADTEDTVAHTLKRVPIGFIVLNRDKAGVVYDSGTAWTSTNLYLKCSVATVAVKVLIF